MSGMNEHQRSLLMLEDEEPLTNKDFAYAIVLALGLWKAIELGWAFGHFLKGLL